VTIVRHAMRSIVVQIFTFLIRAKQVPDGPARLDDLAPAAICYVVRGKNDAPCRKVRLKAILDFFQGPSP
jgi:hypothetical protein